MFLTNIQDTVSQYLKGFFRPQEKLTGRWLTWIWIVALYGGGIYLWILFFNHGNIPFSFHDWSVITAPRLTFLKDALTRGILPLWVSRTDTLGGITQRYLSVPDAFLSPQVILLRLMSIGMFVVVNQLLLYTMGFLGLLWFKRRFSLSAAAFTVLFLLFNFNGHVLAHFGVGHDTWGGYFLFPWFVALIIQLIDGDESWAWVARMSLLMLLIWLQGSFHQYVWALIFLGVLALTSKKRFLTTYKAMIFSILLAMVRILPPTLLMGKFDNFFWGGYPTFADLLSSLITVHVPGGYASGPDMPWILGWWEFDLYIGLIGAVFLVYFGLYRWLGRRQSDLSRFRSLIFPIAALIILSLGQVYRLVRLLPVGLFEGERVSSRMISIPFVFLVIIGVIEFQRWLDRTRISIPAYLGLAALLFVEAHDLYQNFITWQVKTASIHFPYAPFTPAMWYAVTRVDVPYTMTLGYGLAVSAGSLVVLMILVWLEKRRVPTQVPAHPARFSRWDPAPGIAVTGKESHLFHDARRLSRHSGDLRPQKTDGPTARDRDENPPPYHEDPEAGD